jgi:hypothetical protein
MFPRLAVDAALNGYRRIKLRLSFWIESTLAAYGRGSAEFPAQRTNSEHGCSSAHAAVKSRAEVMCRGDTTPCGMRCFNKAEYQRKQNLNFFPIHPGELCCLTGFRALDDFQPLLVGA